MKSVYEIKLPRPRNIAEIRYDKNFIDISKRIWEDLKSEVQEAQSRQTRAA